MNAAAPIQPVFIVSLPRSGSTLRRRYALRYLDTLGAKTLAGLGYDLDVLRAEVAGGRGVRGGRAVT